MKNSQASPQAEKHYKRAFVEFLRKPRIGGQLVPEEEVELDKYRQPKLKEGQTLLLNSHKPGRNWSVYHQTKDLEQVAQELINNQAHQGYIEEYGTPLEIQTWRQKKNKALCWVEAMGLGDCSANVGTSNWWCLDCVYYGQYHPPVLPKHCSWEYTYRRDVCRGTQKHADANKQWHFSIQGERTRDAIKGGDWGSCHIGTFGQVSNKKKYRGWKKSI